MRYYFAVKDGMVDLDTGEKDDAGMVVKVAEALDDKEVVALVEASMPCYKGRLRRITQEEYERDFGEDE